MELLANPIPAIQNAKHNGELFYHPHALQRMLQRNLRSEQIEQALNFLGVEILENYPQVGRLSPECLILGRDDERRYIHILVTYPVVEVITVYEPNPPKWFTPWQRGDK